MSPDEITPAQLPHVLTLMFSQYLQKARARCLAVASSIACHEPAAARKSKLRHSPLCRPAPEDAVDWCSTRLWLDLDGDLPYSLEPTRAPLPLGATVATVLGLAIHRHLSPKPFRRLPLPLIPQVLIASHPSFPTAVASNSAMTSQHVLVAKSFEANTHLAPLAPSSRISRRRAAESTTPAIQLPRLHTDTAPSPSAPPRETTDAPPPRMEISWHDKRNQSLPRKDAQFFPNVGITLSERQPVLPGTLQLSPMQDLIERRLRSHGASPRLPSGCNLPPFPSPPPSLPLVVALDMQVTRNDEFAAGAPSYSPHPRRGIHQDQRSGLELVAATSQPCYEYQPSNYGLPSGLLSFDTSTHLFAQSSKARPISNQHALSSDDRAGMLPDMSARFPGHLMHVDGNMHTYSPYPVYLSPGPGLSASPVSWSPEVDTRGIPDARWPAPDMVFQQTPSPHKHHYPPTSVWQDTSNLLGLHLGPAVPPERDNGWDAVYRTPSPIYLPSPYLSPPPSFPAPIRPPPGLAVSFPPPPSLPVPRGATALPRPPCMPVPPQLGLYHSREHGYAPWTIRQIEPRGHCHPQLGNSRDEPLGPPPGLDSPQWNADNALRRSFLPARTSPPPEIRAQFDLRSDDDEVVVPNRNGQQTWQPGAIGGDRRPLAEPVQHTFELPVVPTSVEAGNCSVWPGREKHPWQVDTLAYSGPNKTQPILSHNGYTFNVIASVARGSVGHVVAAQRTGSWELYAVKISHKWRAQKVHWQKRSMTIEEKNAMAHIANAKLPYLAPLLMSWEDQYSVYFVMPFYSMNLDERLYLESDPISKHDKLLYSAELIAGLGNLCQLNIVHRDIKPSNILIDAQGRAVISDFGLCAALPPGLYNTWRGHDFVGTPEYMAPEIRDGGTMPDYGASVDVYSLGVVLQKLFAAGERSSSPDPQDAHFAMHRLALPIDQELRGNGPDSGNLLAALLPLMLQVDPRERIPVVELPRYLPQDVYADVFAGQQTHDWTPGPWRASEEPVSRCVEFLSFQEDPVHHNVQDEEWISAALRFRHEEASAKPTDLEYRDPGAFED